jgi:hypothetical protein
MLYRQARVVGGPRLPRTLELFLRLRLSALLLATMDRSAASAFWARDHCRGITQTQDGPAIFVDQHFADAEASWAVHTFWFPF